MVRSLVISLSIISAAFLFFALTNPDTIHVGLLVVPVLLVFAVASSVAYVGLRFFDRKKNKYSPRKRRGLAVLVGLSIALVVLFRSTGGIVLTDILLILAITVVSYIYLSKI